MPWLPINAAVPLTLRSPRSVLLADQAEKLPDSNPSAKIRSLTGGVLVGVGEGPGVDVAVGVLVFVGVGVFVDVLVGTGVLGLPMLISQTLPSFSFGSLSLSTPRLAI